MPYPNITEIVRRHYEKTRAAYVNAMPLTRPRIWVRAESLGEDDVRTLQSEGYNLALCHGYYPGDGPSVYFKEYQVSAGVYPDYIPTPTDK